jgi:hypothetical protein
MGKLYKCSDTINRRFTVEWDGLWKNGGFVKSKNDLIIEENQRIENAKIEAENQAKMAIEEEKKKVEELNCSMTFSDPKVPIRWIDNRIMCCCCNQRYAQFENNANANLSSAKVSYLIDKIIRHTIENSHSIEHFNSDVENLCKFLRNQQYENVFVPGVSLTATMMYTSAKLMFGKPKQKTSLEVNKYEVKSKFCSLKCENYCYGQCN